MKTLSIIIISYNEIQHLSGAIDMCLNQKMGHDYEIIIGDDGSSDGSIDVIKGYASNYPDSIRYFVMERSENDEIIPAIRVSNVIKKGISLSEGKYLLIVSADDVILGASRLKEQLDYLESNPPICACFTDYKKFWPDGKESAIVFSKPISCGLFWGVYYAHISCFVFNRRVLSNQLRVFCDDTGLLFSILKTGKVAHIPMMGFGYRQRDESIMHESDELELRLCELLIYQDVLNAGGMIFSSISRFSGSLKYVRDNYKKLSLRKYDRYISHAKQYENDIISWIKNRDQYNAVERLLLDMVIGLSKVINNVYRIRKIIGGVL